MKELPKSAFELMQMIVRNANNGQSTIISTDAADQVQAILESVGRNHLFATNRQPTMGKFLTAVFEWMDDKKLSQLPFIGVIRKGQGYIGAKAPAGWSIIIADSAYISAASVIEIMVNQKRESLKK